jgi:hypothetical protein
MINEREKGILIFKEEMENKGKNRYIPANLLSTPL